MNQDIPSIPDSHPASQYLNAQQAALGAGAVIENAASWPSPIDKIKLALAAVERAVERGENNGRVHKALAELVKATGEAYLLHKKAIGWQSRNDVLDQLNNLNYHSITNNSLGAEAIAAHPCPVCGNADRKYETLKYWPKGRSFTGIPKRQSIATCKACGHTEGI